MKKLILTLLCASSFALFFSNFGFEDAFITDDDMTSYGPKLSEEGKQELSVLKGTAKKWIEKTVSNLKLNMSAMLKSSSSILKDIANIIANVDKIQWEAENKEGFIANIESLVKTVENIDSQSTKIDKNISSLGDTPMLSVGGIVWRSPVLFWNAISLRRQVDALNINAMLSPVNSILGSVSSLIDRTLSFRNALGSLADKFVAPELVETLKRISSLIATVHDSFKVVIEEGKKRFGSFWTATELAKKLWEHKKSLELLLENLKTLETEIPPLLHQFLVPLNRIIEAVNGIKSNAKNFKELVKEGVEERRKETITGIVGPRLYAQEVMKVVQKFNPEINTIIGNMGNFFEGISNLIKKVISTLIVKVKETIDFEILHPEAYMQVDLLPPTLNKFVTEIKKLESLLAAPQ